MYSGLTCHACAGCVAYDTHQAATVDCRLPGCPGPRPHLVAAIAPPAVRRPEQLQGLQEPRQGRGGSCKGFHLVHRPLQPLAGGSSAGVGSSIQAGHDGQEHVWWQRAGVAARPPRACCCCWGGVDAAAGCFRNHSAPLHPVAAASPASPAAGRAPDLHPPVLRHPQTHRHPLSPAPWHPHRCPPRWPLLCAACCERARGPCPPPGTSA